MTFQSLVTVVPPEIIYNISCLSIVGSEDSSLHVHVEVSTLSEQFCKQLNGTAYSIQVT